MLKVNMGNLVSQDTGQLRFIIHYLMVGLSTPLKGIAKGSQLDFVDLSDIQISKTSGRSYGTIRPTVRVLNFSTKLISRKLAFGPLLSQFVERQSQRLVLMYTELDRPELWLTNAILGTFRKPASLTFRVLDTIDLESATLYEAP